MERLAQNTAVRSAIKDAWVTRTHAENYHARGAMASLPRIRQDKPSMLGKEANTNAAIPLVQAISKGDNGWIRHDEQQPHHALPPKSSIKAAI